MQKVYAIIKLSKYIEKALSLCYTFNNLVIANPELAEVFDLSVSNAKLYNFLGDLALVLTRICGFFTGMIF